MNNEFSMSALLSLEKCLEAYKKVVAQFGYAPLIQPGRIQLLGWDLEYVCGSALASFIDQLLVRRLNDFIPDNDHPLILDCGANIGLSVLNYRRQFPRARIIAFEPDPLFAPVLRRNLYRNGAEDIQIIEAGAWVYNGMAKWFSEGIDGSHIINSDTERSDDAVVVQTVDLSDYLADPVDLLKLDIEGAEYEVVIHIGSRLQNVKNILIECHFDQTKVIPFGKMLKELAAAGFKLSLNSFGTWRDLIRQTPVLPNHWEQYLLVACWRGSIPLASPEESLLPYIGAKPEIELQSKQAEAQELWKALDAAQAQQRALETREIQWFRFLRASSLNGRNNIEIKQLEGPFMHQGGLSWSIILPGLEDIADGEPHPSRSLLTLFEDENLLQPAHALHDDIRASGRGRFSHWTSNLYFSTSDGSDPNTNGRKYIVLFVNPALESGLDVRERELIAKEGNLNTRAAELATREVALAARETELTASEVNLNEHLSEAEVYRAELSARETEVNRRAGEVDLREVELNERSAGLTVDEAGLAARESRLNTHAAELEAWESKLNDRVNRVTAQEAAYESLILVRIRRQLRRIFGV